MNAREREAQTKALLAAARPNVTFCKASGLHKTDD